jgi:hypothetical protein
MLQAIIKVTTAAQLRALRKHSIDIKDHNARQDEKDLLFKVDTIISSEDKKTLE